MNTLDWSRLAGQCSDLVHEVSALMSLLTPRAENPDPQLRLQAGVCAAQVAQQVIETLADMPELLAHAKGVMCFQSALLSWHRAVCENNPMERRYQTALMQQSVSVLTTCLHVESHALNEYQRLQAPMAGNVRAFRRPQLH